MRYSIILAVLALGISGCMGAQTNVHQSVSLPSPQATQSHPYAGFWKRDGHCDEDLGLSIAPAGENLYSVTFCSSGGCMAPGTYRPDTAIAGDANYQVIDSDNLGVSIRSGGYQRYVRCEAISEQ